MCSASDTVYFLLCVVCMLCVSIKAFAYLSIREGLCSCAEKSGVTKRLSRGAVECAERSGG